MFQKKALIICVDPDSSRVEARRLLLEESGYQVLAATSSKDGLELFAQHPVDVVLVDYEMPVMNGDLVAARMKGTKPHVPVMMFETRSRVRTTKLTSADALVTAGEPWSVVLAKVDELVSLSALFFSRWLEDWKNRRASHPGNSSGAPASVEDTAGTIHWKLRERFAAITIGEDQQWESGGNMLDDRKKNSGWFVAGLGLGALAGILLAPKSGRETRKAIAAGVDEGFAHA
jgi:CheY-like chemotaxis protein